MVAHERDTTTREVIGEAAAHDLLVVSGGSVSSVSIGETCTLEIGRSSTVDVMLDGTSVSRRHAILRSRNWQFTIEDLGSANGTMLRGERLTPNREIAIASGDSIQIGEFVLVLQARRPSDRARHVWSHEYFEARLTEQCERSREDGRPFFLLRIHATCQGAVELISAELGASDVLALLAPNDWGVLLLDRTELDATHLAERLERALIGAGDRPLTGLIGFPRSGTSGATLLAALASVLDEDDGETSDPQVVLRSPPMLALHRQVQPVSRGTINVLILGETGVGKDVLAQVIHEQSSRAQGPFLRLNCASLSESLLESELFGHEKGAFTGAVQAKQGLLESAAGGTVFLDEIGEFPQRLQPKLLQVLENHEVMRVGSVKARSIDVRFVAATNRELEIESGTGRFRSDLYYRLAGFTAVIPPLRERPEDVLPLAEEFVRRVSAKMRIRRRISISDEAAAALCDYPWPGNIRELRNAIERAVVLSQGISITTEHLPLEKMRSVVVYGRGARPAQASDIPIVDLSPGELDERARILEALASCGGNQSRAAALLGVSRSTLLNRLDAYRIRRPRKRPS